MYVCCGLPLGVMTRVAVKHVLAAVVPVELTWTTWIMLFRVIAVLATPADPVNVTLFAQEVPAAAIVELAFAS